MTKNFQNTYSLLLFYGWKRSHWMTQLFLAIRGKSRIACQLSASIVLGICAGFKWFQGECHSNWVPGAFVATKGNIWLFWFNESQFKIYSSMEQRKNVKHTKSSVNKHKSSLKQIISKYRNHHLIFGCSHYHNCKVLQIFCSTCTKCSFRLICLSVVMAYTHSQK